MGNVDVAARLAGPTDLAVHLTRADTAFAWVAAVSGQRHWSRWETSSTGAPTSVDRRGKPAACVSHLTNEMTLLSVNDDDGVPRVGEDAVQLLKR